MNTSTLTSWWRSIAIFCRNVFDSLVNRKIVHRAEDPELSPDVQRIIIDLLHRSHRDTRHMSWWRRFALATLTVLLFFGWMNWQEQMNQTLRIEQKPFRTVAIDGSAWGSAHVAVIPLRGSIDGDPLGPVDVSNTPRYIHDALQLAKEESGLAAVVLYIDSRGGDMYASAESYRLVQAFAKKSKVPVYAYVPRHAYSGAYYIALGADEIIADPVAEVGNIGVIVNRFNTFGFGRRFGIQMDSIKTGQHKDAGGQWKRPNAKDREIDQRAVEVMFEEFLHAVSLSRTDYSLEQLRKEAKKVGGVTSGAWFVSRDAKDKKLIDGVMTFEEFLVHVREGIIAKDGRKFRNVEFVKYDEKLSILDDWKLYFKKVRAPSEASPVSAKENLGACMIANDILDRISSDE